jgi:glutamine amidotransferase
MELLAGESEEGGLPGLGWIAGRVVRFQFDGIDPAPRVPHMGWNYVRPTTAGRLFHDLGDSPRFYFAHSFHVVCDDQADVAGLTKYGYPFASAVQHQNIAGIQFHPEKSHRFGLKVFENFLAGGADA